MNCEQIQLLFTDRYEGVLSANTKSQMDHHLAGCTGCTASFERFSEAMKLLQEPVRDIDPPISFRAEILARVALMPKPARPGIVGWLSDHWRAPKSGLLKLAGAALAATAIVGVAAYDLSAPTVKVSSGATASGVPMPPTAQYSYSGPFLGVSTAALGGKMYHYFTVQLPSGFNAANVNAYVLHDGRALTNDSALSDTGSATLTWTDKQPLSSNEFVNVPVAVVSAVPEGSTLTLLLQSESVDGSSAERKDVAFVPLDDSKLPIGIERGSNLFNTLQAAAASQDINIIVDDSALRSLAAEGYRAPAGVDGTSPLSVLIAEQTRLAILPRGGNTFAIVAR